MTAAGKLDEHHSSEEAALFEIVKTRSFRRGKFTLASGAQSELYFNLKPTMMHPKGALLWAKAFLSRLRAANIDYVGGLEMGAVPVLGGMAAVSEMEGHPLNTFFVRKQAKAHGTKDVIEGLASGESLAGKRVLVVDDVATSGGSILKAVAAAKEEGAKVDTAMVLIDREEGAAENLQAHGIRLLSVFRGQEFL